MGSETSTLVERDEKNRKKVKEYRKIKGRKKCTEMG